MSKPITQQVCSDRTLFFWGGGRGREEGRGLGQFLQSYLNDHSHLAVLLAKLLTLACKHQLCFAAPPIWY